MAGWLHLANTFGRHPKVLRAGRHAGWLYVMGLCYASEQLTDGFIPAEVVPLLVNDVRPDDVRSDADQLVRVGLWEVADNGYRVHDYDDYQVTRSQVTRMRRKEAQRKRAARATRATRPRDVRADAGEGVRAASARTPISISTSISTGSSSAVGSTPAAGERGAGREPRPGADGRGAWFYAEWRKRVHETTQIALPLEPKARDLEPLVDIVTQVSDDGLLVDALDRFFHLSSERKQQLAIKVLSLATFRMALPALLMPEPPAGVSRQTAGNAETLQRFVARGKGES